MNSGPLETPFDATPEEAIAAIVAFDGPVLVDLDETLYLRNSTEDFIDSARPGLLALLLLRILDFLQPWHLTGGEATRDAWRVRLVIVLFPWVQRRWRARTSVLASSYLNRPLLAALRSGAREPIIVTVGFLSIVKPLLEASGLRDVRVVAARGFGFHDRRRGKLEMAVDALGIDTVSRSLVVTDSVQDRPLLEVSARPMRTIWPEARYRRALGHVYLPGEYLTRVKRPGERYVVRGIIQEDFAFWVLASIGLAALPLVHVAGLLLLLLSFWTIYECGYVDNDLAAARFESDPKLTSQFHEALVATPRWQPWIWALASGAAAIFVLRAPLRPVPLDFGKWLALLIATFLWFKLYNRVDKDTRIWMFPFLQLARSAAVLVVVPVAAIGAVFFGAQVLARWVPYYVYRITRQDWPRTHTHVIRLMFFFVLCIMLWAAYGRSAVFNWTCGAIWLWSAFRARDELVTVVRGASRIDRGRPAQ
ncbi:MAG: HAD family hydrolase [Gammaproteobacteria bacterium]